MTTTNRSNTKMPTNDAQTRYATKAPDPDWSDRWASAMFNPLAWGLPAGAPVLQLHDRLTTLGGWAVCVRDKAIAPVLLAEGSDVDGSDAEMRIGRPSDCHENCRELARRDPSLVWHYGYALSDDGMWREHSWCVRPDGGIVETTVERVAYFGAPERD
jgi:hypothetical protein